MSCTGVFSESTSVTVGKKTKPGSLLNQSSYPGEHSYKSDWLTNYPPMEEFQRPFDFIGLAQGKVASTKLRGTSFFSAGHSICHGQIFMNRKTGEIFGHHVEGLRTGTQHIDFSSYDPANFSVIIVKSEHSSRVKSYISEFKKLGFQLDVIDFSAGKTHWDFVYSPVQDRFYIDSQNKLLEFSGFGVN